MTSQEEPLVITAPREDILDAIESVDLEAPWREVAPNVRLVLPRRRPLPGDVDGLMRRTMPPGVEVGLGLDIGPAMLFVAESQLEGWGISADEAYAQAQENVRARVAARTHFALVHERIGDVPTTAFQSREGWASSLLLMPEELNRVFGDRDALVLTPMRDLVLMLPIDADPDFARYLLDEFAAEDMNALDVPPLAVVDGRIGKAAVAIGRPQGHSTMH